MELVLVNPLETAVPLYSCNGIVLFRNFPNMYLLWNPSIRKQTMICCPYKLGNDYLYGLYLDPTMDDDFKVVISSWRHYTVFSCKNRTWTKKKSFPDIKTRMLTFVDGAFYGLYFDGGTKMQYFDLRDEKVKMLQLPKDVNASRSEFSLTRLDSRLCLYNTMESVHSTKIQVWVLEKQGDQYSWMELINMENLSVHREEFKPLCLTKENNVVIGLYRSKFIIYGCCEKRYGEIQRFPVRFNCKVLPCLDSFFFPIDNIYNFRHKRKCCLYK